MSNILVTGATGFIGKKFIPFLLEKGIKVRVLVRQHCSSFPSSVEQTIGDLSDSTSLKGITEGIETVFHLGGYAHACEEKEETSQKQHDQINCEGTGLLLNECIRTKTQKFIFFSTIKVMRDAPYCQDESNEASPTSSYGKAKKKAEELVLSFGQEYGLHTCVLRLALVYGPHLKGNLYNLLRIIDRGFSAFPKVTNIRSLVSVNDVCEAAWLASEAENARGKVYFVTDGIDYSTYSIVECIRSALGCKPFHREIPLAFFKLIAWLGDKGERLLGRRLPFNSDAFLKLFGSSQFSSIRIQKELGFRPRYSFEDIVPDIVTAYRENS